MAKEPVVALDTFDGGIDNDRFHFVEGDIMEADHPAVKKWPKLFGPLQVKYRQPESEAPKAKVFPQMAEAKQAEEKAAPKGKAMKVQPEPKPSPEPEPLPSPPVGQAMRVQPVEQATALPGKKRGA